MKRKRSHPRPTSTVQLRTSKGNLKRGDVDGLEGYNQRRISELLALRRGWNGQPSGGGIRVLRKKLA